MVCSHWLRKFDVFLVGRLDYFVSEFFGELCVLQRENNIIQEAERATHKALLVLENKCQPCPE